MAYDELEPSGNLEPNFMAATICATIVNVALAIADSKGRHKVASPLDFMPNWDAEPTGEVKQEKEQTVEQMKAVLVQLVKSSKKRGPNEHRRIDGKPRVRHKRT